MGDIVIALPLYQTVPVEWLFNFVNIDKTRCVGHVAADQIYIVHAMSKLVELAFANFGDKDWDRLVIWEHDMVVPDNALNRIANYPADHDVVGALYFQHAPPHHPLVYMRAGPNGSFHHLAPATIHHMVDNPALYPVDAVGFGFTAISRRLLENWDPSVKMFAADPVADLGHDFWFCLKAKEQGFTVALDSNIVCGHLTQRSIGLADHDRYPGDGEVVVWEDGQVRPFDSVTADMIGMK